MNQVLEKKRVQEEGVVIMDDDGEVYSGGGHGDPSACGWGNIKQARISDERFVKKPTDLTYQNSPYTERLKKGKIVKIVRTTSYKII